MDTKLRLNGNLARFNSADDSTKRTAVHEAGHMVLAKQAGMKDVRGWVNYGTRRRAGTANWIGNLTPLQWLTVCAAGAAAELAVFGSLSSDIAYSGDMRLARRAGWNRETFYETVYDLAERLDVTEIMAQEVTTRHYSNR